MDFSSSFLFNSCVGALFFLLTPALILSFLCQTHVHSSRRRKTILSLLFSLFFFTFSPLRPGVELGCGGPECIYNKIERERIERRKEWKTGKYRNNNIDAPFSLFFSNKKEKKFGKSTVFGATVFSFKGRPRSY